MSMTARPHMRTVKDPEWTPRQREVLGFPRPGDEYWTDETLEAVALRYPRMDMAPYRRE